MADDPYLAAGRKALSGDDDTSSSSAADPYVAAGRKVLATTPAPSDADTKPPPSSTPYDVEHSWLGIPAIHNFAAGVTQGARDVVKSGLDLGAWVDKRVPALAWLDQINPLIGDPAARQAEFERQRQQYEASPEGQSYAGGAGRFVGQVGTTAPLVGPVAKGVGAGVNALATVAPRVPAIIPWAVRTATEGGAAGGAFGALTAGSSDKPVGQSIEENAELGAALGPALSAVGKVAGATYGGAKNWVGQFTGKTEAAQIEAALADARARAGAPAVGETGQPQPAASAAPSSPQAAGAQVTSNAPAMDPDQALASKLAGFEERMSRQPKLGFDNTEYVKNSTPTTAEMMADPELAQQQRVLAAGSPEMTTIDRNNNQARFIHFDDIGPGPMELTTLSRVRDANAEANLKAAFANKGDVDTSGVTQLIEDIRNSRAGKMEPVQTALNKVEKALQNRAGSGPETDPEQLHGVGEQINFMMSKLGGLDTPGSLDPTVKRALTAIKEKLYDAIEPAAPGFAKFRSDYQRDSIPIDVGQMLQEYRPKLLGGNDGATMSLQAVNSMLKSIGARLASGDVTDAASKLTDAQLEKLFNLRADLQRQNNRYLARPAGSNTQHDINLATEMGLHGVTGVANRLMGRVPVAGDIAANALENAARNASARNKAMLTNRLLFPQHPLIPPEGGYGP